MQQIIKYPAAIAVVILFSVLILQAALDEEATALVTSVQGEVTLQKKDAVSPAAAEAGTQVFKGDKLTAGKKGKATIYFMDGSMVVLDEGEQLEFGATFAESNKIEASVSRGLKDKDASTKTKGSLPLTKQAELDLAVLTPSGVRAFGVQPVSPAGFISSLSPEVAWYDSSDTAADPGSLLDYTVIILNSDLEEVFRGTVQGAPLRINRVKIAALQLTAGDTPETYYWDVYRKGKEPKKDSQFELEYSFVLVDRQTVAGIAPALTENSRALAQGSIDESTFHMLNALAYKNAKLYGEAAREYEWFVERKLAGKQIYRELCYLYSNLGKSGGVMQNYYITFAN